MAISTRTPIAATERTSRRPAPRADAMPVAVVAVGAAGAVLAAATGRSGPYALGVVILALLATAAAIAVRSGPIPVRGGVAFVVGLAGTAAGAGIGVRHLLKAGWSIEAVAGLVGLLGGLLLIAVGSAALVRATPRWWRTLTVPVVVVIALVAVWSTSIAFAATVVPPTQLDPVTPADRGLNYQDAEFTTADGARLSGWYLPSTNGAAVVLLHGAGSTRSAVLDHAAVLARHGYGVLLFDARGHGRSAGRGMDFGWYGDLDIASAVTYLSARPEVDDGRIAAVGLSMGGEQAIGAAASDGRIRAVVAEGVTNRTAADKEYQAAAYGWRGALQQRIDQLTYAIADLLTSAGPPISLRDAATAAAPRPILLITAGNLADETLAASHIQTGGRDTVRIWQAPDTGHTGALARHPQDWEQHVIGFLTDTLGQ